MLGPSDLAPGQPTPGIRRLEAFAAEGTWVGRAHTAPEVVSGWHHHGDHETFLYVVSGRFRLEIADGVLEGGPGSFFHIPARVVHREANPSAEEAEVVLFRSGSGSVVVNVEGPDG